MTLKIKDADGLVLHVATTGTGTQSDPIKTQQAVEVSAAIPAGTNNIGDVNIAGFPAAMVAEDRLKVDPVADVKTPGFYRFVGGTIGVITGNPTSISITNITDSDGYINNMAVPRGTYSWTASANDRLGDINFSTVDTEFLIILVGGFIDSSHGSELS